MSLTPENQIRITEVQIEAKKAVTKLKAEGEEKAGELMVGVEQVLGAISEMTKGYNSNAKAIDKSAQKQIKAIRDSEVNAELNESKAKGGELGAAVGKKVGTFIGFFTRNKVVAGTSGFIKGLHSKY